MSKRRVLVTGASGFLGRHLVPELRRRGFEVTAPSSDACDLRRPGALEAWLDGPQGSGQDHGFDIIFHLAAWTRAGGFCRRHGGEQWLVHQAMDSQVLRFWAEGQPNARLVTFGTSVAYAPSVDEHHESHYLAGEPKSDYFGYAMAKRALYAGARSLAEQHGLRYLHLVPSTLYGPDYHVDGRPLHFIYDLMRKIARGKRFSEPVVLWGDGGQRRELVHVGDAAQWILDLSLHPEADGLINLGAGEDHSIRDFAHHLCALTGYDFDEIRFDTEAFVGARAKRLGTERLDELLPDRRRTGLRQGLSTALAWVENHLDQLG